MSFSGLLQFLNTWKCTMLKRKVVTVKVRVNMCKLGWDKTCKSPPQPHWLLSLLLLLPLLSLSRCHLSPASPPRVCVLSRHLCLSPPPGGSLLGQALPAAARGPGADCQESGHLERWGGQTCLLAHTMSTHEKQTLSSFTYPTWRHLVVSKNCSHGALLLPVRLTTEIQ